jgi:FdhE protein
MTPGRPPTGLALPIEKFLPEQENNMHAAQQTVNEALTRTVETACGQRPTHEPILRAFQAIYAACDEAARVVGEAPPRLPACDSERFAQGAHLLAGWDPAPFADALGLAAEIVFPALSAAMPKGEPFEKLHAALQSGGLDLPALAASLLQRDGLAITETATACDVSPGALHMAIHLTLGAVLDAVLASKQVEIDVDTWGKGVCPVCGSFPSIAMLAKAPETQQEALVGGGGQKYLHCGLCGQEWRYRRDGCPACEASEPGSREVIFAEQARHERVEICHNCNGYWPCLDLRDVTAKPDFRLAPLTLLHLDVIAQSRGFKPLSATPWNLEI